VTGAATSAVQWVLDDPLAANPLVSGG